MSEVKVNKISPRSGTTITLGDSGDTFTIPSGVTLSNAGTFTSFQSTGIDDNATSTAITIDSSENVGIGTTSPQRHLHINASQPYLQLTSSGTGTTSTDGFQLICGQSGGEAILMQRENNKMTFYTNGIERMRISNGGNVGIGQSSLSSPNGATRFLHIGSSSESYSSLVLEDNNNTWEIFSNNQLSFRDGTSSRMTLDENGNVGIGTSSPNVDLNVVASNGGNVEEILELRNNSTTAGTGSRLRFVNSTVAGTTGNSVSISSYRNSDGDQDLIFETVGSEAMRIDSSGNVSIGTTDTSHVGYTKTLNITSSNNTAIALQGGTSGVNAIFFGDGTGNPDFKRGVLYYYHSDNSMRFRTNDAEQMRITSSGKVGIGTSSPGAKLHVDDSGGANVLISRTSTGEGIYLESDGTNGNVRTTSSTGSLRLQTNGNNTRLSIGSSGKIYFNTTDSSLYNNTSGTGDYFSQDGNFQIATSGLACADWNRMTSDGNILGIWQAGTQEGTISVSGSTVSYNGFTGTHWSRFTNNSKPTILKGTVLETLDEMCDWYNLEFNITDEEGNTTTKKIPHVLADGQSVGDTLTYNYEGTDYQATIVKEADIKHMKSKVSDTIDAKNVYGVFVAYDEDGEGYNDFYVASVGSFVVRIKANETIAKGDLLQSNGDGTAKVQTDDAVRSSSFAKVLSTTVIETYEDGSFIVPCSLMC